MSLPAHARDVKHFGMPFRYGPLGMLVIHYCVSVRCQLIATMYPDWSLRDGVDSEWCRALEQHDVRFVYAVIFVVGFVLEYGHDECVDIVGYAERIRPTTKGYGKAVGCLVDGLLS